MWSSLIFTLVGIIITLIVAKHYFKRTVDKKLAPYIISAVSLLADADDEVAHGLKIYYHGVEINDPFQIHYGIFNMLDLPIADCKKPLVLDLPKGIKVVEAKLVGVYPEGREIDEPEIHDNPDGSKQVQFPFKILNKREGFAIRLLLDGAVNPTELRFKIQAEGLPPVIKPEIGTFYIDIGPKFDWRAIAYGFFIFIGGIGSYYGLQLFRDANRLGLYHATWFSILLTTLVIGWALATIWTMLMGVFITIGVGFLPFLPRRDPAFRFLSPLFGYGWKGPATRIEVPVEGQVPEQVEQKKKIESIPIIAESANVINQDKSSNQADLGKHAQDGK